MHKYLLNFYEMHLIKFVNQLTCVFVCFKLQYVVTKPIQSSCNLVFVFALNASRLKCWLPLPFLQCFLSKEIKTFGKQNSFHLEDEVKTPRISIWISWVFLCGFPLHIFSNFHYSAIRADAANHHRVDIHSLM